MDKIQEKPLVWQIKALAQDVWQSDLSAPAIKKHTVIIIYVSL